MPSFKPLDNAELKVAFDNFNWKRVVNAVHVHHTWRPNHAQWQGEKSMRGMYHYHVVEQGWEDIAMHLVIDPSGHHWIGRDWNKPPASSPGHNGDRWAGPFMIEMVGDFDKGRDALDGEQLEAVLFAISYLLWRKELPTAAVRFHREFRNRTCPGSAIDKTHFLSLVQQFRETNGLV